MYKHRLLFVPALALLLGCNSNKTIVEVAEPTNPDVYTPHVNDDYRASRPLDMKMLHTKLYLKPDFSKAWMYGTAYLTVTPHFYPSRKISLDAKGFQINRVELVGSDFFKPLQYQYDGKQLHIELDHTYTAGVKVQLLIDYIAKPNELKEVNGSTAIQGAKGLYFINPDGADSTKPVQLWTQGETESNSCWYPTIDAPNQKTSQEIYLTVDTSFVTLSNGDLVYSTENGDGTRTDYWEQKLQHAPYLTMLAVGKFHVAREQWRGKEVSYYVEPEFAATAAKTYPNTVEMLEFYSNLLGVPYPWDKYAQVSVRDYVSGAMENTGAVIFGEWAQRTERELLDGSSEGTVAHEMFHHWFGDLVTAESWSNLAINESFATYGSYLWDEHKYGAMEADRGLYGNLSGYLNEAKRKQEDVVRFYYEDKEDMFDGHSYSKGSRILHMLRKEVGDKAFFASLKLFLTRHAHQAVEVQQLRLAFEEVTGRDLNWFFNQWFYAKGHPVLHFNYGYDAETSEIVLKITQKKSGEGVPLYRLPMRVDIYTADSKTSQNIVLSRDSQEFRFRSERPLLVNADADKMLLCEKTENKTREQYLVQFQRAPLFVDQYEALLYLRNLKTDQQARSSFVDAMQHEFWFMRQTAIQQFDFSDWKKDANLLVSLQKLAKTDPNSAVRAAAVAKLGEVDALAYGPFFLEILTQDSSFRVIGTALPLYAKTDSVKVMEIARSLEPHRSVRNQVLEIYAAYGDASMADFFESSFASAQGWGKVAVLQRYSQLAQRLDNDPLTKKALAFMKSVPSRNNNVYLARIASQESTKLAALLPPAEY